MSGPIALERMRCELEAAAVHLGKPHDLRFKAMFGGLMAYLDERPCAWLSAAGIALKLPAVDQSALLRIAGTFRLLAKPGAAPSRNYVVLPAALGSDTLQLARWLARSGSDARR